MANLTETSTYEAGIYQLETSDPALGGAGGVLNTPPRQLANRTRWLRDQIQALVGSVIASARSTPPSGYLWCNGLAVSRATYPDLFAAITIQVTGTRTNGSSTLSGVSQNLTAVAKQGMPLCGDGIPAGATVQSVTSNTIVMSAAATSSASGMTIIIAPWGVGDGVSTFNLPDLRGRAVAGRDDMGGTAANRLTNSGTGNPGIDGGRVGASGGVDRHTLTVGQMPAHTHTYQQYTGSSGGATPPITGTGSQAQFGSATSGSNGSGEAHPIVQPTAVVNYFIKH